MYSMRLIDFLQFGPQTKTITNRADRIQDSVASGLLLCSISLQQHLVKCVSSFRLRITLIMMSSVSILFDRILIYY